MQAISNVSSVRPKSAASSLQAEDNARASWIFRALVQAFLLQQNQAPRQLASSEELLSAPMPLHTELKVARARQLGTTGLTGSQPVITPPRQVDASGSRFELNRPEIHSDGTVSYSITRLSQARTPEDVLPPALLADGLALGRVPTMPVTTVKLPDTFMRHWFFDEAEAPSEPERQFAEA